MIIMFWAYTNDLKVVTHTTCVPHLYFSRTGYWCCLSARLICAPAVSFHMPPPTSAAPVRHSNPVQSSTLCGQLTVAQMLWITKTFSSPPDYLKNIEFLIFKFIGHHVFVCLTDTSIEIKVFILRLYHHP